MVLVAAIAAGVLVNTADMLQESAEQTGEESQAQVSDRLRVIDVYGDVDKMGTSNDPTDATTGYSVGDAQYATTDGSGSNFYDGTSSGTSTYADAEPVVHELGFLVMRASGSNDINLETVTISWQGPDGPQQTTIGADEQTLTSGENRLQVTSVAGSNGKLLESSGDRSKITIKLGAYVYDDGGQKFSDDNMGFLTEGDEVVIKFNTEAGATVTKRIKVPSLIQDDETIEL
jgi:flagellin FlaB